MKTTQEVLISAAKALDTVTDILYESDGRPRKSLLTSEISDIYLILCGEMVDLSEAISANTQGE